jgi:hypothetical protein
VFDSRDDRRHSFGEIEAELVDVVQDGRKAEGQKECEEHGDRAQQQADGGGT